MSADIVDLDAARARRETARAANVAKSEVLRAWLERVTEPAALALLLATALWLTMRGSR